MKTLYKLVVNRSEKKEEKTDNGDGSFTVKTVEVDTPVNVLIKLPSRKDRGDWSTIYNIEFGKACAMGLQTADSLERSLSANSGENGRKDSLRLDELLQSLISLSNSIKEDEAEKKDTTAKQQQFNDLSAEYQEIERPYKELQTRTAEFYAQDKTITWCVLHLTFFEDGLLPAFRGASFEEKLNNFYEVEETSVEFIVFNKVYLCFYSYLMGEAGNLQGDELKSYFDSIVV